MAKSLAQRLNEARIWPNTERGKVTLFKQDEEGDATEEKVVGFDGEGYVDEHPEGSDRGGFVPYWESGGEKAYHYEPDGEWYEA